MVRFGRAAPLALGALSALAHPAIARGDDRAGRKEEEAEERRAPHDWTLAAGVGLTNLFAAGAAPVGSAGPLVALMIERRMSRSLWLMGRASGSIGRSEQDVATGVGGLGVQPVQTRTVQGGGALGLRWVFNPDRLLELSSFVTAGVSHSRTETEASQPIEGVGFLGYDGDSTSVQGQLGVSVDRELTEGLGLRLSMVVAQAGWSTSQGDVIAGDQRQSLDSEGLAASLTLSPTLEVRFSF